MPESRPFVGIDFGFRAGTSTALYYSSIKNGTFNVCTDTGDLYIDINDQRIATKDIISMSTEEDIKRLTNPYQRIYYAEDTYNLWRYDFNSRTWKQVAGEKVQLAIKAENDKNGNPIDTFYQTNNAASAKYAQIDQHFLQIEREIEDITSFEIEIVDSYEDLPPVGDSGVIYFVPRSGADPDTVYDEYIWITKEAYYEKIGVSTADLTDYYTKTEVNTKLNGYYNKEQTYDKSTIDDKLATKSSTAHTHDDFTFATATQNGLPGFVPAPSSSQYNYILTAHGWDINSGSVQHAESADYATNAGSANYSTKASSANYSTKASSANYSTNSGTANYAINAGNTDYATNAGTASNASTAQYAVAAKNAVSAQYASSAGYTETTGYAVNSGRADNAYQAEYASGAGTAASATYDSNGKFISSYISSVTYSVAAGGKAGSFTFKKGDSSELKFNLGTFTTATASANGKPGLVPAPTIEQRTGYILSSEGWTNSMAGTIAYANNAGTAVQASKDGNGKDIASTYITNLTINTAASGKGATYQFTRGDSSTVNRTLSTFVQANISTDTSVAPSTAGKPGLVPAPATTQTDVNFVLTPKGWSNAASVRYTSTANYANSAGKATNDSAGSNIRDTYFNSVSVSTASGKPSTFTFSRPSGNNSATIVETNTTYANFKYTSATTDASGTTYSGAAAGLVPSPGNNENSYKGLVLTSQGWKNNVGSVAYANKSGSATSATKDAGDREIAKTYFSSVSVATATDSHTTLTLKAPGNTTGSTVLIRNDNNKYSEASTAAAGLIKKISTTNGAVYTSNGTQGSWTTNAGSVAYSAKTAAATMSTYATKDSASNTITETYFNNVSTSTNANGTTITLKRPAGTTAVNISIPGSTYGVVTKNNNGLVPKASSVTGYVFTSNGSSGIWTKDAGSVAYATKAEQDVNGVNIASTYLTDLTISTAAGGKGATFKYTRGNGGTVNRTLSTFEKSTSETAGSPGLVPAPATTQLGVSFVLTPNGWSNAASVKYASTAGYAYNAASAASATYPNGSSLTISYGLYSASSSINDNGYIFTFRQYDGSSFTRTIPSFTKATTATTGKVGLVPKPEIPNEILISDKGWTNTIDCGKLTNS